MSKLTDLFNVKIFEDVVTDFDKSTSLLNQFAQNTINRPSENEIEKFKSEIENIHKRKSDKMYEYLENKMIIVPSELHKENLLQGLIDNIGDRAKLLDIEVCDDIDDIMIVNLDKIDFNKLSSFEIYNKE